MTQPLALKNKMLDEDSSVHDWYRFVLSYPPHLVREYLERFKVSGKAIVLDPFCGTGTTLVECKKQGICAIGIDATPMGWFASTVKTDWRPSSEQVMVEASRIAEQCYETLQLQGIHDEAFFNDPHRVSLYTLSPEQEQLLLKNSISPLPLHKALVLRSILTRSASEEAINCLNLAYAKAVVSTSSNLHFGPEVGIRKIKEDAAVVGPWFRLVKAMARDLETWCFRCNTKSHVLFADAREAGNVLPRQCIDAVITSPPYPNEKDYTRTTRLESVLLRLVNNKRDLREMKEGLLRSNSRNIYKGDKDHLDILDHQRVGELAKSIEEKRIALGKNSGFERQYTKVVSLYFGGMKRHLSGLSRSLKPGAHLAYVVGDQASFFRIPIHTGEIIAEIAGSLGYSVESIDLFRTRPSTVTGEQLREEVVVMRWDGKDG